MISIGEMKEKRFQFLRRLYELSEGGEPKRVDGVKLAEELGFDERLTDKIVRYLSNEKQIEIYGGGQCRITHKGIKEVERALSPPEGLGEGFPPASEDLTLLEKRLVKFFQDVGFLHSKNVHHTLQYYLPLMKRYPHIAAREMHRFRIYFTESPSDNVKAAVASLDTIAGAIPELRDQIIQDLGAVLYEYKDLISEVPDWQHEFNALLSTLGLPISARDSLIRTLARSIVSLGQPAILVVGAGFSYDTMPVTTELSNLLVSVLRLEGVENPAQLLQENDREVWQIVKRRESDFKRMFAGWCAGSKPSFQHTMAAEMLHDRKITHLISFNWDDLCERAYATRFGAPIPEVTRDKTLPDQPSLWKLHGDVEDLDDEWIFPYEPGRVFDSLMESLEQEAKVNPAAYALIVGYSEWEPEVKAGLIEWLGENVPTVLRVRPNWPEEHQDGIPDSAKRFFQRLKVYMELEARGKS